MHQYVRSQGENVIYIGTLSLIIRNKWIKFHGVIHARFYDILKK